MLVTLLALVAAGVSAAEGGLMHDALDKPIGAPWSWVREETSGHRVAEGKTLEIAALKGTLWRVGRNDAKNLLVRPWPAEAGDAAEITVTVTFAPQSGGEQAGVMLYLGDDDYVKLVRESLENKRWIVMGREEKGDGQQIAKVEEPSDTVTLHLTRRGTKIEGSYESGAQDKRIPVGACELPATAGTWNVCLFAHGGPAEVAQARWATFKNFFVTKLTPAPAPK